MALVNATLDGAWTLQSTDTAFQGRLHDGGFWSQANPQVSTLTPNLTWRSGVVGTSSFSGVCFDMLVSAVASPSLTLQVYPGSFVISRAGNAVYQGYSSSLVNITVSNADATNPRIDSIVARVEDTALSDANLRAQVQVITGTPAGSPSAPAIPAGSVLLSNVTVAANATTITNAQLSDKRKGVAVNGTVRRLLPGDLLTDVGTRDGELRDTGAGIDRWTDSSLSWVPMVRQDNVTSEVWTMAAKYYTTSGTLATTSGTTEILSGMDTGTINYTAGNTYEIEFSIPYQTTVNNDSFLFLIRDTNLAGTALTTNTLQLVNVAAVPAYVILKALYQPTVTGTKKFVGSMLRVTGTGSCLTKAFGNAAYVTVKRIGANSLVTVV